MKPGTKSLLFGAHQFLIHPFFVFIGWWKLYGFPWDPKLWIAFVVHDWGYWGCPNIDGPEGRNHIELGAVIMYRLFNDTQLYALCYYHSRSIAKDKVTRPSKLCFADKMAFVLEPWWLYLPRTWLTGELQEYIERGRSGEYGYIDTSHNKREWLKNAQSFIRKWIKENIYYDA